MDRLGFFKQGLSSMMEAAQSVIGLKKAAESFTEAVEEALSDITPDIGLHLPSIDATMYDSPSGSLYEVGQMGYTMVEAGCYYNGTVYGVKVEEFHNLAKSSGLKIAGLYLNKFYEKPQAQSSETKESEEAGSAEQSNYTAEKGNIVTDKPSVLSEEDKDWWNIAIDSAALMKCQYITTPSYPIESNDEILQNYAQCFSAVGAMASAKGIQFCFHPSRRELMQANGESILDRIAELAGQEDVSFVIDTLEATEANRDICSLIKRYGKRIAALHLHDADITNESGRIDFDKIIRQARECGVKDIFIEVSNFPLPPQNCVERSLRNVELLDSLKF